MSERRESASGHHFHNTYRDCARKFYIQYILGLRPIRISSALLFGGVLHEALAGYLQTGDPERGFQILREEFSKVKGKYESQEQYDIDLARAPLLYGEWLKTWSDKDQEQYEVLAVEEEYSVPIGPPDSGLRFTVRIDAAVRERRTKNVYIMEHKTTGWSVEKAYQKVVVGDQIAGQLWAVNKVHPEWNCRAVIPDILYNRGKVFTCARPGIAYKTQSELHIWEMGLYGTMIEIAQKYKGLATYPWPILFPPHKNFCSLFGCEYTDICLQDIKPGQVPPGFERDERVSDEVLNQLKLVQGMNLDAVEVTLK